MSDLGLFFESLESAIGPTPPRVFTVDDIMRLEPCWPEEAIVGTVGNGLTARQIAALEISLEQRTWVLIGLLKAHDTAALWNWCSKILWRFTEHQAWQQYLIEQCADRVVGSRQPFKARYPEFLPKSGAYTVHERAMLKLEKALIMAAQPECVHLIRDFAYYAKPTDDEIGVLCEALK